MRNEVPGLEPLRSILNEQDYRLVLRMAKALGVTAPFSGLVSAIHQAVANLSRLCQFESFSKLHQFRDTIERIASQLRKHPNLPTHLTAAPDLRQLDSAYRLFFERGSRYPHDINERIGALKAAAFTDAVARNTKISETFASHLLTLQRSAAKNGARSTNWQELARDLPFTNEQIRQSAERCAFQPVHEFLRELAPILDGKIPDLEQIGNTTTGCNALKEPAGEDEQPQATEESQNCESDYDYIEDAQEPVVEDGLVAWQQKRSSNAHRIAACGFASGWGHLHPEELRAATAKLVAVVRDSSSSEHELACFALICLASGLPPKLALTIPVTPNDDLWLDVDSGHIHWNLNKIVKRKSVETEPTEIGYEPSYIVRLPLPKVLAFALKRQKENRDSTNSVYELLFPRHHDRNDLLSAYESFLKLDDKGSHCPRPSRFSYSFGRCILSCTGQDVVAALTSMDFTLAAPGQLHYICIKENLLFEAIAKTYEFLTLGPIVDSSDSKYIGSPLRLPDVSIADGCRRIMRKLTDLTHCISPRMDLQKFVDIFNALVLCLLSIFVFLTAHRGTRLSRLTYAALYASLEFLLLSDKESNDYSSYRIVPRFPTLNAVLNELQKLIRALSVRMNCHDRELANRLKSIADGQHPNCPVFFFLRVKGATWELAPIRTDELALHLAENVGAAKNFGRHFFLSKLVEMNVPRMLARFFLGHSRGGTEPHGSVGGVSVRTACSNLGPILETIALEVGFSDWEFKEKKTMPRSRPRISFPAILKPTTNQFVANYIASVDTSGHVSSMTAEPCPFDRWTLMGHTAIEHIRSNYLRISTNLSPWPRVFVALIVFDGIIGSHELEAAWNGLSHSMLRIGHTPVLDCSLATVSRPLLLQTPTSACLNRAIETPIPMYSEVVKKSKIWIESLTGNWFQDAQAAVDYLGALMQRWMRIEIPPYLLTACNSEFSAASISIPSIARVAHGRPSVLDADGSAQLNFRRRRLSADDDIAALSKIVNDVADTKKRHGEERKRLRYLHDEIVNHLRSSGCCPLANDVAIWLQHEATCEKPLETSSLASYLSKLKHGLKILDPETRFGDLDPEDWLEFRNAVQDGWSGEQLDQRCSILRRFSRYWRSRGSAVPGVLFAADDNGDSQIRHASSVYVSLCDCKRVRDNISAQYEQHPLLSEKALAKFALFEAAPFRSGEISRIRTVDVGLVTQAAFITSSGFSHLKNQRVSRGSVALDDVPYRQLVALSNRVSSLSRQQDGYLWLLDDASDRFSDTDEIDAAISCALRLVTGEASARPHSMRGSTLARQVAPEAEHLLQSLAAAEALVLPAPSAREQEWLKVSSAAGQARHSRPLSTLRYYCAMWPVQLHAQLGLTLERIPVDDSYAQLVEGLTPEALRQALSRSRRTSQATPSAGWSVLGKRLEKVLRTASVETLLTENAQLPILVDHSAVTASQTNARRIHYLLLRLAEIEPAIAIDETRIPAYFLPSTEAVFQSMVRNAAMGRSKNSLAPLATNRHWKKRLGTTSGHTLLAAAASCVDVQMLSKLVRLLDTKEKYDIDEANLLLCIRRLRTIVPDDFTFCVLPSLSKSSPYLSNKLKQIDPLSFAKRSSTRPGVGFTVTLTTTITKTRGPQPDGFVTHLFRQALQAQVALILHPLVGDLENV